MMQTMKKAWSQGCACFAWIGYMTMRCARVLLVVAMSVAIVLPMTFSASTAVAQEASHTSQASQEAPTHASEEKPTSNSMTNPEVTTFASPSTTSSTPLSSVNPLGASNPFTSLRSVTPLERSAREYRAQVGMANSAALEEYRAGCNWRYARGECITKKGDGAGSRATNGHFLDVINQGYRQPIAEDDDTTKNYKNFSAYAYPRGYHPDSDDETVRQQASEYHSGVYAVPYPDGTYLMKRLRNLAFDDGGNGIDVADAPLDDVADFVFMKRNPKLDGSGFVWDVYFNMGGRTHGAANALNYFTIPKNQILDRGSKNGYQYVRRTRYVGVEGLPHTKYKKHSGKPSIFLSNDKCRPNADNPDHLCPADGPGVTDGITTKDVDGTLAEDWTKLDILSQAQVGDGSAIGSCSEGSGFACMHSKDYGFPDAVVHKTAPQVPASKTKGFSAGYVHLIDNMHKVIAYDTQQIFTFVNTLSSVEHMPYSYQIHFTTSTAPGHENDDFYYAAGSYYGIRSKEEAQKVGSYNLPDPYDTTGLPGDHTLAYSLKNGGRIGEGYRYSTLYQQWYGVPRVLGVQTPPWQFPKGTGMGPLSSNDGELLAKQGVKFSSMLLGLVNEPLNAETLVNPKDNIGLEPDYNTATNQYARGNQWYRTPTAQQHNTKDTMQNPNDTRVKKMDLIYDNGKIHTKSSVLYRVVEQNKIFLPKLTEERNDTKYYKADEQLPDAKNFIHFEDVKQKVYDQAKALVPNLFLPSGKDSKGNRVQYGSVKTGHDFPLNDDYANNSDGGAEKLIKDAIVHDVQWSDKYGSNSRSHTLNDAETVIAVRVPVESSRNPCEHNKILEDYKAEESDRSVDEGQDGKHSKDKSTEPFNDLACVEHLRPATHRYIWHLIGTDLPYGQKLTDQQLKDLKDGVYKKYERRMGNSEGVYGGITFGAAVPEGEKDNIEVLPRTVRVKYAKITFWDNSVTTVPVVFRHADAQKPTLNVRISVDGKPLVSVPKDGLRIPVGSKIRFYATAHDDSYLLTGLKQKAGQKTKYDDLAQIKNLGGAFSGFAFADTIATEAAEQNQEGWITAGDGAAFSAAGEHTLTFQAWDKVGNETTQTLKLIAVNDVKAQSNVWWDKQPDGRYIGRVQPLQIPGSTLRSLAVRIRGIGKPAPETTVNKPLFAKPAKDKSASNEGSTTGSTSNPEPKPEAKPQTSQVRCPEGGDCLGIVIQCDSATGVWRQVNSLDASRAADETRADRASQDAKSRRQSLTDKIKEKKKQLKEIDEKIKAYEEQSAKAKQEKQAGQEKHPSIDTSKAVTKPDNDSIKLQTPTQPEAEQHKPVSWRVRFKHRHARRNRRGRRLVHTLTPSHRHMARAVVDTDATTNKPTSTESTPTEPEPQSQPQPQSQPKKDEPLKDSAEPAKPQATQPEVKQNDAELVDIKALMRQRAMLVSELKKLAEEEAKDRASDGAAQRAIIVKSITTPSGESGSVTFDPQTGNIAIDERLAELGSRIYVDAVYEGNKVKQTDGLWPVDGTQYKSEPLPIDIAWPNGLVQANPYEVSLVEQRALSTWLRNDPRNKRLFAYRHEAIGVADDDKQGSDRYSCKGDDRQYKICVVVTPQGRNEHGNTMKTITAEKLEDSEHTELNPAKNLVTRFVRMREDYTWEIKQTKLPGHEDDPGFEWHGHSDANNDTRYLVYRWNVNAQQAINTNDVLNLLQGKPRKVDPNFPQPSLRPLNTNDAASIHKVTIENTWGGYHNLPKRYDNGGRGKENIGYAFKDGKCQADGTGGCQWVNVLDLVQYKDQSCNTNGNCWFPGAVNVNSGVNSDPVKADKYVVRHDFIMPSGDSYNGQSSNENLGNVITSKLNNPAQTMNDYKQPFRAIAIVNNGDIKQDILERGNKNQDTSRNIINVWFMPVDAQKPTIQALNAKAIKGECLKNDKDLTACGNPSTVDLENSPWFEQEKGVADIADQLKLDDDFDAYSVNNANSDVLKNALNIDIVADNVEGKPKLTFVKNGKTDKDLLRRFVEHYSVHNTNDKPAFKLIATTQDSFGNMSEKTTVGYFTTTWTKLDKPTVAAYDSQDSTKKAYASLGGESWWLYQNADASTYKNKHPNAGMVRPSGWADRMVVSFQKKSDYPDATVNTASQALMGTTIALCKKGGWKPCDGYSKDLLPDGASITWRNGTISFAKGTLVEGSVIRARQRKGYGPWTQMPGVRAYEDVIEDITSGRVHDAYQPFDYKSDDLRDMTALSDAKDDPMQVCRPDFVTEADWEQGKHGSDCVYFGVAMHRRIVTVHPLILGNAEKHAINMGLRYENRDDGAWLDTDREVELDKAPILLPNQTMITWHKFNYEKAGGEANMKHPKLATYDMSKNALGHVQDVPVITRGWRSRYLVPLPRENHITRFIRIRALQGCDNTSARCTDANKGDDGLGNGAADLHVKLNAKKRYVRNRSQDAGFTLSQDGKSLFYRYDLNSVLKDPMKLNYIQEGITFAVNKHAHPENECGNWIDGKPWKFSDCQPNLHTISGADKVSSEMMRDITTKKIRPISVPVKTEVGTNDFGDKLYTTSYTTQLEVEETTTSIYGTNNFQVIDYNGRHLYTYTPPSTERNANTAPYYINIVDAIFNRYNGGDGGWQKFMPNDMNAIRRAKTVHLNVPQWGLSNAVKDQTLKFADAHPNGETNGTIDYIGVPDKDTNSSVTPIVLSVGNTWMQYLLSRTQGLDIGNDQKNTSIAENVLQNSQSVMRLYMLPTLTNNPPVVSAKSSPTDTSEKGEFGAFGKSEKDPYYINLEKELTFTFMGSPNEDQYKPGNDGKVHGKDLVINAYDDADTLEELAPNLQICAQKYDESKHTWASKCESIIKRTGPNDTGPQDVSLDALKSLEKKHGFNAIYRVVARAKDHDGLTSVEYDTDHDGAQGRIVGYFSLNNFPRPVAMPFTGGWAAVLFVFLFAVLMGLFFATGGFGRRGWLNNIFGMSANLGKHCGD